MKLKSLIYLILACSISFGEAKPSGGRSFSSSSRSAPSRSSPKPSRPAPTPPKPATLQPSASNKPSTAKPATTQRVASNVDQNKYQDAVKSGKAFPTREAAVNDFKAKNASTYQNKFTSEPAKRPEHIPSSYKSPDGNTYNISYNQGMGGYGYMNNLGTFMLYDTMSDMAMMSMLMSNQGYYHGAPPVAPANVVHHNSGGSVFVWILSIVGIGIIIFVVVSYIKK